MGTLLHYCFNRTKADNKYCINIVSTTRGCLIVILVYKPNWYTCISQEKHDNACIFKPWILNYTLFLTSSDSLQQTLFHTSLYWFPSTASLLVSLLWFGSWNKRHPSNVAPRQDWPTFWQIFCACLYNY